MSINSSVETSKRKQSLNKFKTIIVLLALLYIGVTATILSKNWGNIFYAVTHKEDVEWVRELKDEAWEEKRNKMLEEKQNATVEEGKEVSQAKKKELPSKLKELIKDSPMEQMETAMIENKYGVSPYLIVGVAQAESNFGKDFYHWKDHKNYNFWGIKPKGGIRDDGSYLKWYNSPEEAVNDFCRLLAENYIEQGFDTVDKIVLRYVGSDNENWKRTVKNVLALGEDSKLIAMDSK